jgi:hypothetical protein
MLFYVNARINDGNFSRGDSFLIYFRGALARAIINVDSLNPAVRLNSRHELSSLSARKFRWQVNRKYPANAAALNDN